MATEPTGDRRTVATDALATLGTFIDETQKRDAIHLAVEPVIAGEYLSPGDRIVVRDGVAYEARNENELGIVDPFLKTDVCIGQRFWFIMNPRMVHSLRHVWTHPAFPDEAGTPAPAPTITVDKEESERWLRAYAERVNPYLSVSGWYGGEFIAKVTDPDLAYNTLMDGLRSGNLVYHGVDMHSQGDLIDADELQHHASIILGRKVDFAAFEYFSCTC